jgi:hypothetical protein
MLLAAGRGLARLSGLCVVAGNTPGMPAVLIAFVRRVLLAMIVSLARSTTPLGDTTPREHTSPPVFPACLVTLAYQH